MVVGKKCQCSSPNLKNILELSNTQPLRVRRPEWPTAAPSAPGNGRVREFPTLPRGSAVRGVE